jgi:cation-transporting ATPase E
VVAGAGGGSGAACAGLSAAEVAERTAAGRSNDVPRRGSRSISGIVRANVLTRFNAIIGVLFVIILVIGPPQDALFGVIILLNTLIGIVQELRARRTLERLAILSEARPRVWRDGVLAEIPSREVVLGDVIELGRGDEVVVDGVVISSAGLEVDESLLTGESDPLHKRSGSELLSGSFAVGGTGRYRATRVGRQAYAARLTEEARRFTLVRSELRAGIDQLLRIITWLMVPTGALVVYSQLHSAQPVPDAVRGMVAALVPMVPEGLVLLTSLAFAVGVVRLGRRRCLVQELPAIEGLARVDVVCTDKTGTLTEQGMRVAEVRSLNAAAPPGVVLAALAGSDSRPNASLRAIAEAYPQPPGWPLTAVAPFSSARGWSGASFGEYGDWVLGAPDVLLPVGNPVLAEADALGCRGLRVLLLAGVPQRVDAPDAPGKVAPAALVVLEQRIRPDAASTLRYFAEQDVEVKVLSGDNPASVGAVATALRLPHADQPVDARTLPADRAALAERVAQATVFGRVAPARKREVVAALHDRGHTVAMTGDGVNDVLALKDADIGVAMGSGAPAVRAVAQIVLLDDRFAALPHVVAEGRRVVGNIERVGSLFLTKTVYAVLLAILIGVVRLPFPFLPRHLTLIGALTIGVPAFFLALAPNTERARTGFTRRVLRVAVPAGVVAAAGTFLTYLVVVAEGEADLTQNRTAAVITMFGITLWVTAVVARPYRPGKVALVAAMAGVFALVLLVPVGQRFFALDPSPPEAVLTALAVAAVGVLLVELGWRLNGASSGPAARPDG